jgi:Tol biopolymer transport system component
MSRWFAASMVAAALLAAPAANGGAAAPYYAWPVWSPDGSELAFVGGDQALFRYDIYVMKANGTGIRQVTHDGGPKGELAWSPNGKWLAYSDSEALEEIHLDGTGERRVAAYAIEPDFSPSGRRIAYANGEAAFYSSVYVMRPDGSKKTPVALPRGNESLGAPTWSPGGEKLAFSVGTAADASFVTPYLAIISRYFGRRMRLAVGHTIYSADWSRDGRQILLVEDPKLNDPRLNTRISVLDVRTRRLHYLGRKATFTARWSPDGRRIAFSYFNHLYVMNADGSHVRDVTPA